MHRSQFDYHLPNDLIAQSPSAQRGHSRLLVANALTKQIQDMNFSCVVDALKEHFPSLPQNKGRILLIANDSKVYPARVPCKRTSGGKSEVFLLQANVHKNAPCLLKPKGKLALGDVLVSPSNATPLFSVSSLEPPMVDILPDMDFFTFLDRYGEVPLPPYIKRACADDADKDRYQNVYANEKGSVAAPTAGLHFTPEIMDQCQQNNIDFACVTLHVGLGTFLPVTADRIADHHMHQEHYFIPAQTLEKICLFLKNDWPIVFVGTTSLRTVESFLRRFFAPTEQKKLLSLAQSDQLFDLLLGHADRWFSTDLFLYPEHKQDKKKPLIGNGIVTNFHQPESTLCMLIAGLMGFDFWQKIYQHAIENRYRFLSYGDSSLLIFDKE